MSAEELIDVDALQVGMFIHLDLGWMRHPFPLSSFCISSEEQIGVLRKLGLRQVRWTPARSRLKLVESSPAPEGVAAPDLSHEQMVAMAQRESLRQQREALARCEAQYGEATKALSELHGLVLRQPAQAAAMARDLSRSLLEKMLVQEDVNLRLLNEAAGDRACAHGLNVCLISLLLARATGMEEEDLIELGVGALLHDVGKFEVESRLRFRSEQFSSAELAAYQWHVAKGVELGQRMGLSKAALSVVAQHHEQADGAGFPQKLPGDKVHPAARVVALVNRFDGLCNPPVPGAKALTPHEALSLLFAQGRSRFDATMLNGFIRMMGVYPPGSAVQLSDDRFALVVSVNANRPLRPTVLIHEASVPSREALFTPLETQPNLTIRRSLRPADLPEATRDYLRPRSRVAYFPQADAPNSGSAA